MGAKSNAMRSGLGTFLATLGGELSDIRRNRRQADRVRSEGDSASRRRMGEMTLRQALEDADPRSKASQMLTEQQTSESAARTLEIPRAGATKALNAETASTSASTRADTERRIGEDAEAARKEAARNLTAAETKTEKIKAWTEFRDADPKKYWEIYTVGNSDEDVVESAAFKSWSSMFKQDIQDASRVAGGGGGYGHLGSDFVDPVQETAPPAAAPLPRGGGQMIGDTTTAAGAQEVYPPSTYPRATPSAPVVPVAGADSAAVTAEDTSGLTPEEVQYIRKEAQKAGIDFNTARQRLEMQLGT